MKIIETIKKKFNFSKLCEYIIYFALIYISTECLNGDNGQFHKFVEGDPTIIEKMAVIKIDLIYFFMFPKILFALLIYLSIFLILYGITNKSRVSCLIISSLSVIYGVCNYIVTQIRGTSIIVTDFFAIQTAFNVANKLTVSIDGYFIIGILIFIFANISLFKNPVFKEDQKNLKMKPLKDRIKLCMQYFSVGVAGILIFLVFNPYLKNVQIWDINLSYKQAGAALTLMRTAWNIDVKEPNGYNIKELENKLNSYVDNVDNYAGKKPNILVVMNESFSDLLNVYNVESMGDNLPFFHSLISGDNIVTGNMHSSFIGTKTANIEFEFLTQNTYTALPMGSYPYQQYITNTVKQSLISYMNRLGYNTYGIHSWYSNGYNRNKIYNFMQFNNIIFKEDMDNLTFLPNRFSTDISTYEYWFEIMKNKNSGENNFTFLLTVQNHLPYNEVDGELTNYVVDNDELNVYLNYLRESDNALKKLISFIQNYDEDTILLFFGDHQPMLDMQETYSPNVQYSNDDVSYIVPFFIWANYDIKEKNGVETSANFLQNILFDVTNLPKDKYTQYIDSIRKEIPVLTTQYYIDKNGITYDLNDKNSPYYGLLKEYWNMVYYQVFDN